MIVLALLGALVWAALYFRSDLVLMRMYQLEEYDARRLIRWAKKTPEFLYHPAWLAAAGFQLAFAAAAVLAGDSRVLVAGWLAAGLAANALWAWEAEKKGLVMTARAARLLKASRAVAIALCVLLALEAIFDPWGFLVLLSVVLTPFVVPGVLIAANVGLWRYELRSRAQFRMDAVKKLEEINPRVIAVAGSYGKTTTKRLLAHVLDDHGDTLPTPKSFNTLLGLTTTINNELNTTHRVFVAEMDAYNPGEIATMCDLVHPELSVLTSVGPAHLERFGSVDRIAESLVEVVRGLPASGVAVVFAGGKFGKTAVEKAKATGRRVITYAAEDDDVQADVTATNIDVSGTGTSFVLSWPDEKLKTKVRVALLGRHQAVNATAALITARTLGSNWETALGRLTDVPPVEHRLQIVPTTNGVTVIDDSYNANPVGVHNALEVLAEMDVKKRIVVTPGIVELGDEEDAENRRYGEHAAQVCDDVIVVEARTSGALMEGARKGGLTDEHLHLVKTLDDATAAIAKLAAPGDVVLFANDLPDTY